MKTGMKILYKIFYRNVWPKVVQGAPLEEFFFNLRLLAVLNITMFSKVDINSLKNL